MSVDFSERGRRLARGNRPLRRFLILCEDTKSAVLYLKRFPVDERVVRVECVGTGMNTDSLMEEAIRRKERARAEGAPFRDIWVVFDRDSFPAENFDRAFDLVRGHPEITACWSNECFEVWYLLHFGFHQTAIGRVDLCRKLSDFLGKAYDKGDATIYDALSHKIEDALRNADRLALCNLRKDNPSTKVHRLIRELRKLAPSEAASASSS